MTAHWGIPDPAAIHGDEAALRRAMHQAFLQLGRRISLFVSLPLDNLDAMAIRHEIAAIGRLGDASSPIAHPQQPRP
jgi:arsenate reductase